MIIVMKTDATQHLIQEVKKKVEKLGYKAHLIEGVVRTVIAAVGDKDKEPLKSLQYMEGIDQVMPVRQPYKLASRSTKADNTVISVGDTVIGGGNFVVFAGPCSVESEEQCLTAAETVKKTGSQIFRGGAFKPRTSPYSFQGLEEEGLRILKKVKDNTGLQVITELIQPSQAELVADYSDIIQIGARNMQNFPLLKAVGRLKTPVFLKRGLSATLEDWLMSAEYILSEGNTQVMLCERGIRTFENAYRNTLDLNAVPALKGMTHLPVIVDPSHGTGRRDLIPHMTLAAIASGADGVMIETHPNPDMAWSDGAQSLTLNQFEDLIKSMKPLIKLMGKTFK